MVKFDLSLDGCHAVVMQMASVDLLFAFLEKYVPQSRVVESQSGRASKKASHQKMNGSVRISRNS